MIYKHFETNKINFVENKIFLFYGKNDGLKNQAINNLVKNKYKKTIYDEKEILENVNQFLNKILNRSLFDSDEIIIIKRASDKIFNLVNEIASKNIDDLIIIINADNLEKKSKLRSFFERSKKEICVAFYPDNNQTLLRMASNFFKEKNIPISHSNINLLVNKSRGDRESLANELDKIESYTKSGNKLSSEKILKLINLFEDYDTSEIIDNCLAKNKNKIIKILNENNFNSEDSVAIIRIFLFKSKKILDLISQYENNNNINLTISSAKPPIFWKDKEITKQQIYKWKSNDIKKLIYKLSEIEYLIKKDNKNSLYIVTDFILDQSTNRVNNLA
jgi:DNA polymerase-3 subunit delta